MARSFRMKAHRPAESIDFEGDLNAEQRAVALGPGGPMLVIAGAGSGKTRTLTYRIARLLRDGVDPRSIMLATFSHRAAREMLHRVELLVPVEARRIRGGTFHHLANRVLRRHATAVGLSPEFSILDREDASDVMAACRADANVNVGRRRFPQPDVLLGMASQCANTHRDVQAVVFDRYPMFASLVEPISVVLEAYAKRKRERHVLDYDDLLVEWDRLLDTRDDVRAEEAAQLHHILVDEYQDVNTLQARIVDRLAAHHRNLCVVGDDSQAIYGFRGASAEPMLRFRERWPDAVEHRLEVNYRSTPEIVALANESIARNEKRLPKTLRSARASGVRPASVPCGDHFVQSRFIAEYILHLLDEGRCLMDIAILYRSHWHAMEIQLELQRRDIPFTVRGGLRFFEQAHIKDVLAFLRVKHNGADDLAWRRILRLPPRIGGRFAERIWAALADHDDPLDAVREQAIVDLLPPASHASWRGFAETLAGLRDRHEPSALIDHVCESFYVELLSTRWENASIREQDIRGVADFAGQYKTVEAFLSDVVLAGEFNGETCEDGPDEQLFVTLSTVHQAKGLEWPIVFVPWVADGRFPTDLAMGTADELEEERRVFHVATTRAMDELYLVVPQVWSNRNRERILMKPSRFLVEIEGTQVVEQMTLEEDLPDVVAGEDAGVR